jgi:hypothetical protein
MGTVHTKQSSRAYLVSRQLTSLSRSPIAVGTASRAAPRTDPSVRDYRTGLLPRVSGVEACVRVGVHHADGRQPSCGESVHPVPVDAGSLAATPKRPVPGPCHLGAGCRHRVESQRRIRKDSARWFAAVTRRNGLTGTS